MERSVGAGECRAEKPLKLAQILAQGLGGDESPDRFLLQTERPSQFLEGDILQLPDPFARNAQSVADLLQRPPLAATEAKALSNNFFFGIVEHFEQASHLPAKVLVTERFKRSRGFFVRDALAEFRRAI